MVVRIKATKRNIAFLIGALLYVSLWCAPAFATPNLTPLLQKSQWIWYVSKSGGNANAIAAKAKQYGIKTVLIKSGDGVNYWSQFTKSLVDQLHAKGLYVCGWQYAYGRSPKTEALVLARAADAGADCLIPDLETEWEGGHYKQARTYMKTLREKVGYNMPIGVSSFPYTDYHPSFPYSAFFAKPYGADANVPQVYWRAIGTSVNSAMSHTYLWNDLYDVPITPVAGTWLGETQKDLTKFQLIANRHGSTGQSYWDWQETKSWQWPVLAKAFTAAQIGPIKPKVYPALHSGSRGDAVIQLQLRLTETGYPIKTSGYFYSATVNAVKAYQSANGLPATGAMDFATWNNLLGGNGSASGKKGKGSGGTKAQAASLTSASANPYKTEPRSAHLKAKAYEIPPKK